jgi:hypothetical protein
MSSEEQWQIAAIADREQWQARLAEGGIRSLYNSWGWGEYKLAKGWQVQRLLISNGSRAAWAACQVQIKRVGPCRVLLVQGGLRSVGLREEQVAAAFTALLTDALQLQTLDILLVDYHEYTDAVCTAAMLRSGLAPHLSNKMYSFFLANAGDIEAAERGLSGNWRHNLNRARKKGELKLHWCEGASERATALDALAAMYGELAKRKVFAPAVDVAAMRNILINDLHYHIVVASVDESPVAVRIGYQCADYLVDFLAASNEGAIKNFANYLLMWSMFVQATTLGLRGFECGGIDPAGNVGVYNFKKGLGATLTMNGPLWVHTKSRWLKRCVSAWLAWKTS